MTKQARTEEELRAAPKHLGYELEQCAAAVRYLRDGRGSDQVLHNALVESVVVHVRLFADFLLKSTPATDVSRADFTPGRKWGPAPKDSAQRLREAGPLATEKLAHLTWPRVLGEHQDSGWRFEQLVAGDLLGLFRSWVNHVADQRGTQDSVVVELRQRLFRAWYLLHGSTEGTQGSAAVPVQRLHTGDPGLPPGAPAQTDVGRAVARPLDPDMTP